MVRETISGWIDHEPDFHWRGQDVTRIENLSDIIFALALGMLVSSSTPPVRFDELIQFLMNIFPVSAAFAIMVFIWHAHFTFFRRYGLTDEKTIFLNSVLLLLVLFLAYPLRFIFDSLFTWGLTQFGYFERAQMMQITFKSAAHMMAIYAVGYALVFFIIGQMYAHAMKMRRRLELDDKEALLTRASVAGYIGQALVSLVVMIVALFTKIGPFAGMIYFFNWPLTYVINWVFNRQQKAKAEAG